MFLLSVGLLRNGLMKQFQQNSKIELTVLLYLMRLKKTIVTIEYTYVSLKLKGSSRTSIFTVLFLLLLGCYFTRASGLETDGFMY